MKTDERRFSPKISELNACLLSTSCHFVLLIVLGLITAALSSRPYGTKMTLQLGEGPGDLGGVAGKLKGDLNDSPSLSDVDRALSKDISDVDASLSSLPVVSPSEVADSSLLGSDKIADEVNRQVLDAVALKNSVGKSGRTRGLGGQGTGDQGEGTGGGGDPNGQPGFFGIPSHGGAIVYVLDTSGSMNDYHKFKRAQEELIHSLRQYAANQKFFVILFSDGAYPMESDEFVTATPEHIGQLQEWLSHIEPSGGTEPLGALSYALAMKPDEVYFLSDGLFDVTLLDQLKKVNTGRRIPIHTIDFTNYQSLGLMKLLARHSGGKFRFVQ